MHTEQILKKIEINKETINDLKALKKRAFNEENIDEYKKYTSWIRELENENDALKKDL